MHKCIEHTVLCRCIHECIHLFMSVFMSALKEITLALHQLHQQVLPALIHKTLTNALTFSHSSPVNLRRQSPPRDRPAANFDPLWHSARHVSVNSHRTDRFPPLPFTPLPLYPRTPVASCALHTLLSWCLFISFVFCACVKFSYRLNPQPSSRTPLVLTP